jgi:hypothetical protein
VDEASINKTRTAIRIVLLMIVSLGEKWNRAVTKFHCDVFSSPGVYAWGQQAALFEAPLMGL